MQHIDPNLITADQEKYIYANVEDVLNAALLAKPINNGVMKTRTKKAIGAKANIEQLLALANIESMNANLSVWDFLRVSG